LGKPPTPLPNVSIYAIPLPVPLRLQHPTFATQNNKNTPDKKNRKIKKDKKKGTNKFFFSIFFI
jgi:hypothetical protein